MLLKSAFCFFLFIEAIKSAKRATTNGVVNGGIGKSKVQCGTLNQWAAVEKTKPGAKHRNPFPWAVSILYLDGNYLRDLCVGSVIESNNPNSSDLILTGSACFEQINLERIYIFGGAKDLTDSYQAERQVGFVKSVFKLPIKKNLDLYQSNMAVVKLVKPFLYNAKLTPVCLPAANEPPLQAGTLCYLSGSTPPKGAIDQTMLRILSAEFCRKNVSFPFNPDVQMCGEKLDPVYMLPIGGPVVCRKYNRYVQYAVFSFPAPLKSWKKDTPIKMKDFVGIMCTVSNQLQFIKNSIRAA
ncbi:Chymotrypsinogen B [Trichinella zimbabwensis]|uniref:Chymotrypsinogen B n=1 Tax=Trichinella zimbabwensis TaxID=268475 RepID=A0A0V1HXZ7_9BILA|nr:Chymotrypsinogen B [Trichinella zimbabwensis]